MTLVVLDMFKVGIGPAIRTRSIPCKAAAMFARAFSLDLANLTVCDIGADMSETYKETARGGLALNQVNC